MPPSVLPDSVKGDPESNSKSGSKHVRKQVNCCGCSSGHKRLVKLVRYTVQKTEYHGIDSKQFLALREIDPQRRMHQHSKHEVEEEVSQEIDGRQEVQRASRIIETVG